MKSMHKSILYRYCNVLLLLGVIELVTVRSVQAQYFPDKYIENVAPDSFLVNFETSKGSFTAKVHRAWSPLAADRFYHLVRLAYFDEVSIYRVISGYVAQFGIHNDRKVNEAWKRLGIDDEPVRVSNRKGTISFARSWPKTRGTQLFINLNDNSGLDAMEISGVVGYPPFAEIVAGMEVVESFEAKYANAPALRQDSINVSGRAYLDRAFPGLDYIITVQVVQEY